ncbi:hypothetical protein J421_3830 [Gemmatirosa kalamazoonensis]|uniref:DUF4157 domain-containing protein n=1 Tax=Gemmatirosa kalamazoonensis TaxID=861299 RepID=W0RLN9_9BACT|nr:hypothetical protein [Gemmatirosa kalamazoonensis]AHG91367.1 hypothetical protein J421_3830 [Gemmatirosa kalamazoonensis]
MTRSHRLVVAAGAIAAAACQRTTSDHRSYVERAVALAPQIEHATGLRFVSPPKVEVRSADQVRAFVQQTLDDSLARRDVAAEEAAYKRLGLVPDSVNLRQLLARILERQIVGYYDPKSKTLYIVDGADSASAEVTLRHELVHALQDQHANLDSIERVTGENDRSAAAHAALEGLASYAQFASSGVALQAPGAWDRVRGEIRENMERTPVLSEAPFVVRETLLFPYLSGAEFARRFVDRGGGDSLLKRLPTSTEQVLHADAYFGKDGGKPDAPTTITLPTPTPGSVAYTGTLGEFEIRLLLYHHTEDLDLAARAAQGWDGDRYDIVRTPQGDAFVWVTVWDSAQDAAEFFDALGQTLPKHYPDAKLGPAAPAGGRQYTGGGGRTVLLRATDVQGRPAVLYVDAPPGATPAVDLTKVTLHE